MKIRRLNRFIWATLAGMALCANTVSAQSGADENADVDAYFSQGGEMTVAEHAELEQLAVIEEKLMDGKPAIIPRGLRGNRAPTFRFVHWTGEIGDPTGRFVSPLIVKPTMAPAVAYRINAQILGFHGAKQDWGKRASQGTLTIELRGSISGEPVTWLYAQQFDVDERGFTNIGYEYVAQRDGSPDPAVTTEPNLGLRIQLMRSPSRGGKALRKLIRMALVVTGIPLQLEDAGVQTTFNNLPAIRVPAMLQEGVALSQAVIGTTAEEVPIWRGGFSSYGVAAGGSRLGLRPGYWMAIDSSRELDLSGVMLSDRGGVVTPTRDGEILDANYLILALEITAGTVPNFLNFSDSSRFRPPQQPESQQQLVRPLPASQRPTRPEPPPRPAPLPQSAPLPPVNQFPEPPPDEPFDDFPDEFPDEFLDEFPADDAGGFIDEFPEDIQPRTVPKSAPPN